MKTLAIVATAIAMSGCTPLPLQEKSLRQAFQNKEECESEASTATGLYKAGVSQGRTWLEIRDNCIRSRMK